LGLPHDRLTGAPYAERSLFSGLLEELEVTDAYAGFLPGLSGTLSSFLVFSSVLLLLAGGYLAACLACSICRLIVSYDSNLKPFGSILLIMATWIWVAIR